MSFLVGPILYVLVAVAVVVILAIRAFLRSGGPSRDVWHSVQPISEEDVEAAIRAKRMIEAIGLYRALHGCGLEEAREAVEEIAASLEHTP